MYGSRGLHPQDVGSKVLRKDNILLQHYTVSQPKPLLESSPTKKKKKKNLKFRKSLYVIISHASLVYVRPFQASDSWRYLG